MFLDATTKQVEVTLAAAPATRELPWTADFGEVKADNTTSAAKSNSGLTTGTTAAVMVAPPASGFVRELLHLTVYNADTAAATVTVRVSVSGTYYAGPTVTLQPGETLTYDLSAGWQIFPPRPTSTTVPPAAAGTVTSIDVSGGATGLTFSGGPVTVSGVVTMAGTLALASGGTGATTRAPALNNLLPVQSGQSGKLLGTDGTNAAWQTPPAAGGSGTV